MQVVYNFGREEAANRAALQRLVASVTRFLDPDQALTATAEGLEFIESRPLVQAHRRAALMLCDDDLQVFADEVDVLPTTVAFGRFAAAEHGALPC